MTSLLDQADMERKRRKEEPDLEGLSVCSVVQRLADYYPSGVNRSLDDAWACARELLRRGGVHDYEAEDDKGWRCKKCGHQT